MLFDDLMKALEEGKYTSATIGQDYQGRSTTSIEIEGFKVTFDEEGNGCIYKSICTTKDVFKKIRKKALENDITLSLQKAETLKAELRNLEYSK